MPASSSARPPAPRIPGPSPRAVGAAAGGRRRRARALALAGLWLGAALACAPGAAAQAQAAGPSGQAPGSADNRGPWALCPPTEPAWRPKPTPPGAGDGRVHVYANRVDITDKDKTTFTGAVVARQGARQLEADRATYWRGADRFEAIGNVRYFNDSFVVTADGARLKLDDSTGYLDNTQYRLGSRHARGAARRIELQGPQRARLSRASYTTCDSAHPDWELRSDDIELDRADGQGTARDVVVRFKGVPFLYLPYIRFPITDERMSGFLFPNVGTSSQSGTDLSVPYYWNIAPDRDATITPRYLSKRGAMLQGEFRYLNQGNRGEVHAADLPNDKLTGTDRQLLSWQHAGTPDAGWSTDVNFNYVSDPAYFQDLGSNLSTASVTHLERRADLAYNSRDWKLLTRVQGFQTLSGTSPYERLPQLTLTSVAPQPDNTLNYLFSGELVHFAHADLKPTGTRLDLQPGVSLPYRTAAGFAVPKLVLRHTQYQLTDQASGTDSVLSRDTPIASLDTGLYFERDASLGGTPMIQTLEPRLYYLYVPYRRQDQIPIFDTGRYDFSFSQLFRDNRFSGPDRQGDANQLTAALTTRLLRRKDGTELFNASLGQIFYFDNRRVTLPGQPVETNNRSSLVAGATARFSPAWYLSGNIQWDPAQRQTEQGSARLQYQPDPRRVVNLAYRYRRGLLENTDVSFMWPLGRHWRGFARWQYSLRDELTQEQLVGVQYDSCCWDVRLLSRRYINTLDAQTNRAIYLEFELKGLSSFGDRKRIEGLLDNGILGYNE